MIFKVYANILFEKKYKKNTKLKTSKSKNKKFYYLDSFILVLAELVHFD